MSTEKLGQEPAFPTKIEVPYSFQSNYGGIIESTKMIDYPGVSKRFYAACAAMQAVIQTPFGQDCSIKEVVTNAYHFADELLKQENL